MKPLIPILIIFLLITPAGASFDPIRPNKDYWTCYDHSLNFSKQVGTYTPGPKPVSYPGELKSQGVAFGGSIIGGIGQSSIPPKYRSGSSSSRKSSSSAYGPIQYDTPKTAPKNLEGVITGVVSTPSKNNRRTKKGLSIRKTTAAEKAKYESELETMIRTNERD